MSRNWSKSRVVEILLRIDDIYLKYNQKDAMFSRSIYFYILLYMFQAVPPLKNFRQTTFRKYWTPITWEKDVYKNKKKKKEEIWPYSKTLCVIKFFEFRFQNGKSHTFLSDNGTCVRIYFSFWNISLNYNQQVATFSRFLYFYIYCSTFFRWFLLWETSDKRHSENIWLQLLGKRTCTKKKLTIFQNIMRNNIFLISFSKRKVTHISFTRWNLRLDFFLFLKYISKL